MPYFMIEIGNRFGVIQGASVSGMKKKDMLETIQLLEEANAELNKNASHPDIEEILTQCQESALLIGNHLETAYPETEKETVGNLVAILEDYCENIYQVSTNLTDEKNLRKIIKKITRQLSQLHNGIKYDLPEDRKEVVFLPYKASMWDSLESIWKAADADENADAYVIPIPYYDKNPDGSFREMHYEGDQYPSYVPITHYEDYDLEFRKPDVIYIHNPYDEYNYVTSVHPSFYSSKLKKYTNKLVYIPYFILGEIKPDEKERIEGMKHFCIQPGVLNADKVVVQSEDMKKVYVNVLTEYAGKDSRKYWEDKILGLGSPKFDKVMNTRKEDLLIPKEWEKIIQKPDGSRKKIIFYNTGVSALLNHNEKMLTKMESVFKTFYENREEVALLWRPHPLIESTLTSMRPQLWEEYRKIRDRYIQDGWGIYDDTADMDRAIELSDAYYGDGSSIVQLYSAVQKKILIQEVKDRNLTDKLDIVPYVIDEIENNIYVLNGKNKFIFKADENSRLKILADIEDGKEGYGYIGIVKAACKLILIPDKSDKFAIYDIKDGHVRYIEIDKNIYAQSAIYDDKPAFYKAFQYKNKLFVIQIICKVIVCINTETRDIEYIDIQKKMPKGWISLPMLTYGDFGVCDAFLYLPVYGMDYVIIVNMEKNMIEFKRVMKGASISTICSVKNKLYVFTISGKSYFEIEIKNWKVKKINIELPGDFEQDSGASSNPQVFFGSFFHNEYIWLIPYFSSNMILRMNIKNSKLECILKYEKNTIFNYGVSDSALWLCTIKGAVRINLTTCSSKFYEFTVSDEDEYNYIENCYGINGFLTEETIGLNKYITYITGSVDFIPKWSEDEKKQKNIYWYI